MKQCDKTPELEGLPGLPKKRGRPATGTAKSGAERMAALRAKKAEGDQVRLAQIDQAAKYWKDVSLSEIADELRFPESEESQHFAWLEYGKRMHWI